MFVLFYIAPTGQLVYEQQQQSGKSAGECKVSFCKKYSVPDCQILTAEVGLNDLDVKARIAKSLWSAFGDIPTDGEGSDGTIDEPFLAFERGADVHDIWHWFEHVFDIPVFNLMYSGN